MKLLGLRTLIYPSNDLAADIEWWTKQLGYGPYFNEPFYAGFEVAGYELGLDPNADMTEGPRTYFGAENVETAVDELLNNGCTIHEPITNTGGDVIVATVKKPNGQLLGLIYNPHFNASEAS